MQSDAFISGFLERMECGKADGSPTRTLPEGIYSVIRCGQSVAMGWNASSNVIPGRLIPLDSFVSREEHRNGRKQATRNVHIKSKGRSMTPPPQIQPR
jgi:hypothetical protein